MGLIMVPSRGGRAMNFWIIVCQAAIIGFGNIVSLGNRQEVDKYLPGLWIEVAAAVEEPIELLLASHEHTAKDDPKTSLRMTLGVHEREGAAGRHGGRQGAEDGRSRKSEGWWGAAARGANGARVW